MSKPNDNTSQPAEVLTERDLVLDRLSWWSFVGILLLAFALMSVSLGFKTIFFRDYAIIYEGAYRLWLGQQPYQDFEMPVGPISLLGPWLAFAVWGANWQSLIWCQLGLNALGLLAFSVILKRLGLDIWRLALALVTWVTFYTWPNNLPWYNTTALTLELFTLLAVVWVLTSKPTGSKIQALLGAVISGICAGGVILCKQDFGLLTAALVSILVLVFLKDRITKIRFVLVFWLVLVLSFLLCCWFLPSAFLAQFNYGQGPNATRLQLGRFVHTAMTLDVRLILTIVIVVALLTRNKSQNVFKWIRQTQQLPLLLCLGLVIQSMITYTTSGVKVSHYYHWAPLLISLSFALGLDNCKGWQKRIMLATWSIMLLNPIADAYTCYQYPRLSLDWANGWLTGNPLDGNVKRDYLKLDGRLGTQSLYWPSDIGRTLTTISNIVSDIRSKRFAMLKQDNGGVSFSNGTERPDLDLLLNISELSFLYQDLGVIPPIGVPLWFDDHATFFGPQQTQLAKDIGRQRYAIIILQETHSSIAQYVRPALEANYVLRGVGLAAAEGKQVEVWVAKSYH